MRAPIYQLDSFTTNRFTGNPAAVVRLERFPAESVMQAVAAENNLSETAFLVPRGHDYDLRWFTPTVEVPLCGHATLASAAVVLERVNMGRTEVLFHTASGALMVRRTSTGYVMDFPTRHSRPVDAPDALAGALGIQPLEVHADPFNYLALMPSEAAVRALVPDLSTLASLDRSGVIVTARSDGPYDIVSRYFAPAKGIPEDPVTGGAHCALAPFWAPRLGKTEIYAFQASIRGGWLNCRLRGDRVDLEGSCVFYFEGVAEI